MAKREQVAGLWSYIRAVLLKPSWEFITTGTLMTLLYVGTWWRDEVFARGETGSRIARLLPHWNGAWWLCIGLVVILILTIRESFCLFRENSEALLQLKEAMPFPEIVIEGEYGIFVKNLSKTSTVFNVQIPQSETGNSVVFRCVPDGAASIAPGRTLITDIQIVTPKERFNSYKTYLIDVGKDVYASIGSQSKELVQVGVVTILCEDSSKNRFKFRFPLSYNPDYMNNLPRFVVGMITRDLLLNAGEPDGKGHVQK